MSARADLHLWKLPRGRHGLSRELVVRSQRERLLTAVVRVTAEHGYQTTSVADILATAGVGRESFYKHFSDKEECFLAANDVLLKALEERVGEAYRQPGEWPERMHSGLAAALEWLATDSDVARVLLIEVGTVGPVAWDRLRATFQRFVCLLDDGLTSVAGATELPNVASIAGGAVFARIYEEVAVGRSAELPSLLPQLTFELLLPYIGEEDAWALSRNARR